MDELLCSVCVVSPAYSVVEWLWEVFVHFWVHLSSVLPPTLERTHLDSVSTYCTWFKKKGTKQCRLCIAVAARDQLFCITENVVLRSKNSLIQTVVRTAPSVGAIRCASSRKEKKFRDPLQKWNKEKAGTRRAGSKGQVRKKKHRAQRWVQEAKRRKRQRRKPSHF